MKLKHGLYLVGCIFFCLDGISNTRILNVMSNDSVFQNITNLYHEIDTNWVSSDIDSVKLFSFFGKCHNQELSILKTQDLIMAGATCTERFYSKNIQILLKIYRYYEDTNSNHLISNIDSVKLYDIEVNFCSGRGVVGERRSINRKSLMSVYRSYERWIDMVGSIGIQEVKRKKISPLSFCNYIWE